MAKRLGVEDRVECRLRNRMMHNRFYDDPFNAEIIEVIEPSGVLDERQFKVKKDQYGTEIVLNRDEIIRRLPDGA